MRSSDCSSRSSRSRIRRRPIEPSHSILSNHRCHGRALTGTSVGNRFVVASQAHLQGKNTQFTDNGLRNFRNLSLDERMTS
jgi:hypothetical protein